MNRVPAQRQLLVLAGGGHSHALLVLRWNMRPRLRPPATAVLLVNRASTALYSGMLPGLVAGLYSRDDCAIDLRALCRRAGVGFIQAEITGVDPLQRLLQLQGRPALRFDCLSLEIYGNDRAGIIYERDRESAALLKITRYRHAGNRDCL